MGPDSSRLLESLKRQRQVVVGAFLVVILGIAVVTFALNAVLLGRDILSFRALWPNLLLIGTVLVSLWFNRRGEVMVATLLTTGLVLLAAALPVLLVGLSGSGASLLLFFIPLVMAGLLLGRLSLSIVAGLSMLVVLLAPIIGGVPLTFGDPEATGGVWTLALQFQLVFATIAFLLDRFGFRYQESLSSALSDRIRAEHEVLKGKALTDAIVESLPGLFYARDAEGRLVRWNGEFQRVTGYSDDELADLTPLALYEDRDHDRLSGDFDRLREEGSGSHVVRVRAKDGSTRPYFISGTVSELDGEPYFVAVGIDRSEIDSAQARIEKLNQELAQRLERLLALREIDRAIIGSLDLDLTLSVVLDQVRGRLDVPAARILLFDPIDQTLRHGGSQGLGDQRRRSFQLRLGQGPAGTAALERETVMIDGAQRLSSELGIEPADGDSSFRGYLAVPLVAKGRLQGVLETFHHGLVPQEHDWHDFLDGLSVQAAIALDSASLFESLERSNIELRQAYDTTIEGWSRAMDLKDEETVGHSRRVTDLSVQLAARLGLSGDQLVHIRRGALLHDIGKMGVPDRILLKPGKLDDDEWQVMRRHTTFAHDLLSRIPFLRPALDIPYAHHERWDGGGYPRGLRGEQIPLSARLFAVVDVYDALTSDRPYRKAWSEERALAHIAEESGSHFDPRVAAAFLELVGEKKAKTE